MARQKTLPEIVNAVIYARYSSHSQTEQSIEGQLHDCYDYAERFGYRVVGEYIDRALTGTKDDRPDFQRMMKDAEKHQFQVVLVWKLDRFARNRYDSAIYKQHLKKHGVRVVSVMENITDSPEGIILEGLLESMAEYYSANLSENIRRGQKSSVAKGWFCGGAIPMGYQVHDHKLIPDEKTAPLIRELYRRYADGESLRDIADDFNRRGFRTRQGHIFKTSTFDRVIPNSAYIGEYTYAGEIVPGLSTPIIDKDVYEKALRRRDMNRRSPQSEEATVDYHLRGKLFCGVCGAVACGEYGTSKSGERHYYYSCSGRKHRRTKCGKKSEKKDFLEWYVCEQTVQYVLDPDRMDLIAAAVVKVFNDENDQSELQEAERLVKRLNDDLDGLVEKMIYAPKETAPRIGERMKELEKQRLDAETNLSKLRIRQKIQVTEKEVVAWLKTFKRGDLFDPDFRNRIIDTFINSVYFYNDKIVIFYNIRGGQQTSGIEEISALDEKIETLRGCSTTEGDGGALPSTVEHGYIFLHDMLGLVVFRQ